jgi:hypothetical protein
LREDEFSFDVTDRMLNADNTCNLSSDPLGCNTADIEYYYVSRLRNETAPGPDFVVHPGVPRTVRMHFQYFL